MFHLNVLRNLSIPQCLHTPLHITQPQALVNLRHFSVQYAPRSVLVRAQGAAVAERSSPAAASNFEQLGLGGDLLAFLAEQHLHTPTEIQASNVPAPTAIFAVHQCVNKAESPPGVAQTAAIAEVLKGGDVLLASHTGSGKTLAYLLPLVRSRISRTLPCKSCLRPQHHPLHAPACCTAATQYMWLACKVAKPVLCMMPDHAVCVPAMSCRHNGAMHLCCSAQGHHIISLEGHAQVKLLKDAERRGDEQAKPKRPRALVLGPTRELTDQILGVAKSLSHHAKFRSACVNGGRRLFLPVTQPC